MQVLLTGAAGFLGRALARQLQAAGHGVRALVRTPQAELAALGIEQRPGALDAPDAIAAAADGCDAIVHAAGAAPTRGTLEDWYDGNVRTTDCVLAACELTGVPRLLLTSCASATGVLGEGADETKAAARWPHAYAHTKALAEQRVLAANGSALMTAALRPALLWGPDEPHLLPALIAAARNDGVRLCGQADLALDTCHVDNAADAHVLALARLQPGSPILGKAYFVTQGEAMTNGAYVNALLRAAGYPGAGERLGAVAAKIALARAQIGGDAEVPPLLTPWALDVFGRASTFDIGAARRELGYAPRLSTVEGMSRLSAHLVRARMRDRAG